VSNRAIFLKAGATLATTLSIFGSIASSHAIDGDDPGLHELMFANAAGVQRTFTTRSSRIRFTAREETDPVIRPPV
jgi:hypothetical protein